MGPATHRLAADQRLWRRRRGQFHPHPDRNTHADADAKRHSDADADANSNADACTHTGSDAIPKHDWRKFQPERYAR